MPPQISPLDEAEYDDPATLLGLPGGNLNSDSILWYFMNSPFYNGQANNTALMNQLKGSQEGMSILFNRHAFEDQLKRFDSGFNIVVAAEPNGPEQPWVIQQQRLSKNDQTGKQEILIEGTWYTQGTKILMAPSLLDVLQLRLLSVSTQLQDAFQLSEKLSHFSPATGHTYLPPSYELPKATAGSRIGSPSLTSTEPSNIPPPSQPTDSGDSTSTFSNALFMKSLELTEEYYHEYMDENPLQGEPGSQVFTHTYGAVYARNQAQEKELQRQAAGPTAASGAASASVAGNVKAEPQSTANSVTATPRAGATPATTEAQSRKASIASLPKLSKEKRRKSKGLGSPVTPTAP